MRRTLWQSLLVLAVFAGLAGAAFAQKPILIGVQAPITGQYANEGQGIEKAVKLIAKQVNDAGGLLGRQIQVQACDDAGEASQAAICARQFVNAGVLAVIGTYTSGAALAAEPVYARANVIQTSDGTSDKLTQSGYKTFFRNAPPNSAEAKFTAQFLVSGKGYKRIAILSDHSSFAQGLSDAVTQEVKKAGGNIVFTGFINAGSQDYTAVLTKIKSVNPDVLYFSGYYPDGGLIRAQMEQLHMNADFVGGDANQNVAFAKIAGDAAKGAIIINVPSPSNLPYPAAKQFLADYKAAYGQDPPSIYTFTNADGFRAVIAAIKATQSTDPAKLMAWMHSLKDFQGLTGTFSWDANGERIGSPFTAFEIQADGSYKIIYPASAAQ